MSDYYMQHNLLLVRVWNSGQNVYDIDSS